MIAEKVHYAVLCGMKVIACIGEKLSDRESGQTEAVVYKQLKAIIGIIMSNSPELSFLIYLTRQSDRLE